ncbi:Peptidyl-tRNA hydrolase [Methylophilaceae bacterium]|nr:Peptidyl-tRNA hydrolase [Methylophilaceae bacterium]
MANNSGIQLFVGLGNPGAQYVSTRHNAGFWWIDRIASETACRLSNESKFFGDTGRFKSADRETWLLKPATFMNKSGRAVAALANFYKIPAEAILVIHDELDLPAGSIKLKKGGGHGGHNGLKDIAACLGTNDFWRLRIGIDHPGDRNAVVNYVLNPPLRDEQKLIDEAIGKSTTILSSLVEGRMEEAMLKLHTKV